MLIRTSFFLSAAAFSLAFITSCKSSEIDGEKSDSASTITQNPSETRTGNSARDTTSAGGDGISGNPFVAVLKRQEPVPDALMTGMISVSYGCLIVEISGDSSKKYMAVVPRGYKFLVGPEGDPLIQVGKRIIPINKSALIPGGGIFVDVKKDIEGNVPESCPTDLFGIGE
jgi:hypothetical protein